MFLVWRDCQTIALVDRLAGLTIPDDGCFALVGNTDSGDGAHVNLGVVEQFGDRGVHTGHDVARVVFDPARLGKYLGEFPLCHPGDAAFVVKQNGPGAGGALVNGQYVFFSSVQCFRYGQGAWSW